MKDIHDDTTQERDKTAKRRLLRLDSNSHDLTARPNSHCRTATTGTEMSGPTLKDIHDDTTQERRNVTRLPQEDCRDLTDITRQPRHDSHERKKRHVWK